MALPVDELGAFVGAPALLAEGEATGPLAGRTLAVKDVLDVAGVPTGGGNPTWAAAQAPARHHADAVALLVAAGATVVGKTVTDELAWSLAGTNVHHGTPVNVAAPGRIPGGSSAGSAAAVAGGLVDLALGTDTGGSVRVPASYTGTWGWRPTHGAVPTGGLLHLAPTFDTVGLFTRDATLLADAADVLLGVAADAPVPTAPTGLWLAAELLGVVGDDVAAAIAGAADRLGDGPTPLRSLGLDPGAAATAFRVLQGREAWDLLGAWYRSARPATGPGVAERFEAASRITDAEVAAAQAVRAAVREVVARATAGGRLVLAPAAAVVAPRRDLDRAASVAARAATLQLTSAAGLAGAPVAVLPAARSEGLPLGVAVMGAPGTDRALLAWARGVAPRVRPR